jgi:hypothetical protein
MGLVHRPTLAKKKRIPLRAGMKRNSKTATVTLTKSGTVNQLEKLFAALAVRALSERRKRHDS